MRKLALWEVLVIAGFFASLFVVLIKVGREASRKQVAAANEVWCEIDRLAEIGGDESALKIIAIVDTHPPKHPKVEMQAIDQLGRMRSNKTLPYLKRKFYEGERPLPEIAAVAIGEIGSDEAIDFLIANLEHSDNGTFYAACRGLAFSKHPKALPALEEAVNKATTGERRRDASEALGTLRRLLREESSGR